MFGIINHKLFKMNKAMLLIAISILFSCTQKEVKSEKEKTIDKTREIISKFYDAQVGGDIETMKSMISDDFEYTLNGELDISKTYYGWDEFFEFQRYFGTLLRGKVGAEFIDMIPDENMAIVFAEGRMEGVGGKYENEYALKYVLNENGKVSVLKEYLSDLLLAQKMYGQDLCGEKKN